MSKLEMDHAALRAACFSVARNTMFDRKPISVSALEPLVEQLFTEALVHCDYVVGKGRDPNLITRAVLYLAHVHAIPPMRDDVSWFNEMLRALIELVCPNTGMTQEAGQFLRDVEQGIKVSRADYAI